MKFLRTILFVLIFLLFVGSHPLLASDDSASPTAKTRRVEARKEENRGLLQARKEEVKENLETKRAEAKERFAGFRDERKKALAERVQKALDNINERRTTHFAQVLERLSSVLEKILSRAEKLKTEGKDVSSVETQAAVAQAAIDTATEAVRVQASKDYTITIADETTAKETVGALFKQLQEDLRKVGELVQAAKSAVAESHRALVAAAKI